MPSTINAQTKARCLLSRPMLRSSLAVPGRACGKGSAITPSAQSTGVGYAVRLRRSILLAYMKLLYANAILHRHGLASEDEHVLGEDKGRRGHRRAHDPDLSGGDQE